MKLGVVGWREAIFCHGQKISHCCHGYVPGPQSRRCGSPWHGLPRPVRWMKCHSPKSVRCNCNQSSAHKSSPILAAFLQAWFRRAMTFEKMRDYRNAVLDLEEAAVALSYLSCTFSMKLWLDGLICRRSSANLETKPSPRREMR